MNIINVEDVERELRKVAANAVYPQAQQWVLSVGRNYVLGKISEKDADMNFRVYEPAEIKPDLYGEPPPFSRLPNWAKEAVQRGEELHWFDPVQVQRRPLWQALETIVTWYNVWSAADTRLRRLDRVSFDTALAAAAMWFQDVQQNIWEYVKDKPPIIRTYEHGYFWVRLVTMLHFEREGRLMKHCLKSTTKVITSKGTFQIKDLAGKTVKVLTANGNNGSASWSKAKIINYGVQPLMKITFKRNNRTLVVEATPEHRWLAYRNKNKSLTLQEYTTEQLKAGYRIPTLFAKNILFSSPSEKKVHLSPIGVMHGAVFGDGSAARSKKGKPNRAAKTTLYGAKDAELLHWFPKSIRTKQTKRSIGGTEVYDLPRYFKRLPSINECSSYLIGWLAGYFAADGCVVENGQPKLSSSKLKNILFAERLCQKLGIHVTGISEIERLGFGKEKSKLYNLNFEVGNLPPEFFLLSNHRNRAKQRKLQPQKWIVQSVEKTNKTEEVFCAEVPKTHCFALEGNILTGNCVGNGSYFDRWRNAKSEYYSLRDKHNRPHCTIEVTTDMRRHGAVLQCKGNSNHKPPPIYQPYIRRFFNDMGWSIVGDQHYID